MNTSTDRIEKQIVLKAPRSRVWQAISNAEQFGEWFGVALTGKTFSAGQYTKGNGFSPCSGDLGYVWEALIERIEPEHFFSFRWHPYSADKSIDLSKEPMTLVEFELNEVDGGTLLRVVESGFDAILPSRRTLAFSMNTNGWDQQIKNIEAYIAKL
ncbi:SRPBCC family protein [Aquirhabdus parva]|uniref:Vanillate O-demethylase oxidoreductase VanB n=1 Tax=Aquirhabdus parva TaxID=2283318 RepID=A0A345P9T4_9GAMM|nr:SRPBCC family protein [Aquirhabdus parva]AXI04043.1 vanillate O-demethylase oxidoreductase VanB [Aquirhabdus parva]